LAKPNPNAVSEARGDGYNAAMNAALLAVLVAVLAAVPALANDSSAELTTGGLVFVRNDAIEMRSEDLFISTREIRVHYRFFNKTDRDATVHVAFPMPEVTIEHQDQNISIPTEDPVNLLGFSTRVDGRPVTMQVEQKVLSRGVDRTALLKSLNIPLAPHLASTNAALDKLPRSRWKELVDLGLAEIEEMDAGKGMERHLSARWSLQTTFFWQQTFPAGKELAIEHRYKPSVGGTVMTSLGAPHARGEQWHADSVRKYCIEKDIFNALDRARRGARGGDAAPFSEERIDYILKTGANWSGPIRDFRLVIDKGDPDALVTFCGDGVKKISPTQFEMRKTNFTPEGNISILILKRIRGR
jgi:hypothetical protein